jgi:hypothetical protein
MVDDYSIRIIVIICRTGQDNETNPDRVALKSAKWRVDALQVGYGPTKKRNPGVICCITTLREFVWKSPVLISKSLN